MEFLEFELPIKEVIDQIDKYKSKKNESALSKSKKYKLLQKKRLKYKPKFWSINWAQMSRTVKKCHNHISENITNR